MLHGCFMEAEAAIKMILTGGGATTYQLLLKLALLLTELGKGKETFMLTKYLQENFAADAKHFALLHVITKRVLDNTSIALYYFHKFQRAVVRNIKRNDNSADIVDLFTYDFSEDRLTDE